MRTFNLTLFALIFIFSAAASAQEVYLAESHGRPSYKQELAYEKARVDDFYRLLEEKKKEKEGYSVWVIKIKELRLKDSAKEEEARKNFIVQREQRKVEIGNMDLEAQLEKQRLLEEQQDEQFRKEFVEHRRAVREDLKNMRQIPGNLEFDL